MTTSENNEIMETKNTIAVHVKDFNATPRFYDQNINAGDFDRFCGKLASDLRKTFPWGCYDLSNKTIICCAAKLDDEGKVKEATAYCQGLLVSNETLEKEYDKGFKLWTLQPDK